MIEIPESNTYAKQINELLIGKQITSVIAASSPHKFAWYFGDPEDYPGRLIGNAILSALGFGMFVEIKLSHATLLFSDGVKLRWHPTAGPIPKKHQLLLGLDDGTQISASLQMYGGIVALDDEDKLDNLYYQIALEKPSPLSDDFSETYFEEILTPEEVQKLPLKGALATEQRIPGLGNGCLQDILWKANLNPRRKTNTLSNQEKNTLFISLKDILVKMTQLGGRNTEKDLLGEPGGYQVVMCSVNKEKPCPICGTLIKKESYMGGSIYTCPSCQPQT